MTKQDDRKSWIVPARTVAALLVASVALGSYATCTFSAQAASSAPRRSDVDVVGSGTLTWRQVVVRSRPSPKAARVTTLKQFRPDFRPQFVLALSALRNRAGEPTWYRVSVPGRPNGRTGWVRAASLELRPVHKRLVVYRGARRFEFWDGRRLVRSGKVAVGKPGAETPLGLFYVTDRFDPTVDPSWAILGAVRVRDERLLEAHRLAGGGIVGVHGTPWPWLLGQAVSHGCVRMSERGRRLPPLAVPLGTPVRSSARPRA